MSSQNSTKKVSFSSVEVISVTKKDQFEAKRLWYSRKETSSMRRECMVLSKHFLRLTQRQHYNTEDLIGLEDAKVSKERSTKRKLAVQSILLQQDIDRALKVDDPTIIATLSEGYSQQARTQALERAKTFSVNAAHDESIASLILSEAENKKSCTSAQQPPASNVTETHAPVDITFTRSRASKTTITPENYRVLKGELPQSSNHQALRRKQLIEMLRFSNEAALRMRTPSI